MAHRAQLASKLLAALLFFSGCQPGERNNEQYELVNEGDTALHVVNGIVYYKNHLLNGAVFSLFNNAKDTATFSSFLNGKENGVWKKWYSPERLKEQRQFANGAKTGTYTAYWENGNKQLEYVFLNDEYEGICREWNSNGLLIKEMNYHQGHEDGSQKMFYDNGKVRSNYIIKNGRRYGLLGTKNCVNVSDSIFKK